MMLEICEFLITAKSLKVREPIYFGWHLNATVSQHNGTFLCKINSLSADSTGGEFAHKQSNSVIKKCLRILKQNEAVNRETF